MPNERSLADWRCFQNSLAYASGFQQWCCFQGSLAYASGFQQQLAFAVIFRAAIYALILLVVTAFSSAADDAGTPPKLTSQQSEELQKLIVEFRNVNKTREERDKLVDRFFEFGPVGVRNLLTAIDKESRPKLDHYRANFWKQATTLVAASVRGGNGPQEIATLRGNVLALGKKNDLAKEDIVKVADPALKRLNELLVVERAKVIESSTDLRDEREKLQQFAKTWERCLVYCNDQLPADQKSKDPIRFENYLQEEEELAAHLVIPMDQRSRGVLAANERLAAKLDPEEVRCISACNMTRLLLGLSVCEIDLRMCAAAKDHSHDMESLKFFSHQSPVAGKASPSDRAKRMGTIANAENIFVGIRSGKAVNNGWFHSPGHHKNMLGDYKRIGVGQSGPYFTEMFGR